MTSRQCRMTRPLGALTLWLVTMLLVNCTHTIPLKATIEPPIEGAQVPAAVGVYYNAEFRAYEHAGSRGGDRWVFPLGPASVTLFDQVFPRMFASTRSVQSRPPLSTGDTELAAVIEPKIEAFDFGLPCLKTGTYTVEIAYRFTLYSPRGDPIASWLVKGVGAKPGEGGFEFARWPGTVSSTSSLLWERRPSRRRHWLCGW